MARQILSGSITKSVEDSEKLAHLIQEDSKKHYADSKNVIMGETIPSIDMDQCVISPLATPQNHNIKIFNKHYGKADLPNSKRLDLVEKEPSVDHNKYSNTDYGFDNPDKISESNMNESYPGMQQPLIMELQKKSDGGVQNNSSNVYTNGSGTNNNEKYTYDSQKHTQSFKDAIESVEGSYIELYNNQHNMNYSKKSRSPGLSNISESDRHSRNLQKMLN